MGVLGGTCWIVYAYLKGDNTVMYVTGTQILLYSTYTIFYWFMSKKKVNSEIIIKQNKEIRVKINRIK